MRISTAERIRKKHESHYGKRTRRAFAGPEGHGYAPDARSGQGRHFSAIQFEVEGRRVLDLFAGSGQMGIEALSRGAKSAVFVDMRQDACAVVRSNLEKTRLTTNAQVLRSDYLSYLSHCRETFDLIFLDPPYADDLLERAVAHIARFDILAPDGIMIAESPAEKELPKLSAPYRVAREYRYGRIKVTLYRRDGEETT